MDLAAIERLIARGESEKVELKKSTGQINRAGETLCAFLNDDGSKVIIGITDGGKVVGQEVSDKTRREIAMMLEQFSPPAPIVACPSRPRRFARSSLNAVMHRDYSDPGSYVAIVVFDHRIAVRSVGTLPLGPGPARDQVGTKSALSRHQVQVLELPRDPQAITDLLRLCGRSDRTKFRNQVLRPLLESGLVTMTIPDKPTSSRQRYLTTEAGKRALDELKAVSA